MSFVVFALPRCRTTWLSAFLSYGPWVCGHDELRHCRSLQDVKAWFSQPCAGSVETAGAPFWRLLRTLCPDARVVVVRRPIPEVMASLRGVGLRFEDDVMARHLGRIDAKLRQIEARVPGAMAVQFADLDRADCCEAIFEHCLGAPFDAEWWTTVSSMNIQTNLERDLRYFAAHRVQLDKLAAVAKHRMLADMAPREDEALDGMTIGQEPFETFFRDGKQLFAAHSVLVGEAPDSCESKNVPLWQRLDEVGALQITTARCNGRMFGYLVSVISPSMESPDWTLAANGTFYASPDIRGLGMRLQRASLAALKAKGVKEVHMTAGVRGDGARMGALYRRLGAEHDGAWYRLQLQEGRERWA